MYNEEESIPYLYKRLLALGERIKNYDLEFLFVSKLSVRNNCLGRHFMCKTLISVI